MFGPFGEGGGAERRVACYCRRLRLHHLLRPRRALRVVGHKGRVARFTAVALTWWPWTIIGTSPDSINPAP